MMVHARKIEYIRRQYRWFLYSVLLCFLLAGTVRATYGMYQKSIETAEKAASIQMSVDRMKERYDLAKQNLEGVSTERGMDREIRERYGVKKPGEGVIIIVNE
jgi:hypothetical protein